jgi:hypothetical protein
MWRGVVLVWVIATACESFAEPTSSTAAPHTCKPAGSVLFEIDQRVVPAAKRMTASTRLYENGAWKSDVIDVDGTIARSESGCLEPSRLDWVRADLRTARFKTTRTNVTCRADQRFTVYKWQGNAVYAERTCNELILDGNSKKVLDRIAALLRVPDLDDATTDIDWEE